MLPAPRTRLASAAALLATALWGCVGGTASSYADEDGGTVDGCVTSTTACARTSLDASTNSCVTVTEPDGTACDDDNVCTQSDACAAGVCVGSNAVACPLTACGNAGSCSPTSGCPAADAPCTPPPALVLSGCSGELYWLNAKVGGSSQVALLLDSGSSTIAIASSLCSNCGVSPVYTPGSSAKATGQQSSGLYGDGSGWSGPVYSDTVTLLGGAPPVTMDIVAMSRANQFFETSQCVGSAAETNGFQGILGLGSAELTATHTDAYMQQLTTETATPYTFATQLCDSGGNLWLGGFDPNVAAAPLHYTPLNTTASVEAELTMPVNVSDMGLAGTSLGVASATYGPVDIDTGTTAIYLPQAAYNALTAGIQANATFTAAFGANFFSSGNCAAPSNGMTRAQLDQALPAMSVTFQDADSGGTFTLTLPPTLSYLTLYPTTGGTDVLCPVLFAGSPTILGMAFQRSLLTVFAVGAGKVGFAPSQGCSY